MISLRIAHCAVAIALGIVAPAWAGPPLVPSTNSLVTLDGNALGTAIAGRSAYPTILYDSGSATYHMWVAVVDESGAGSTGPDFYPLRIAGYRHATSTNGTSFATTGTLSFVGSPFATQIFGSAYGEPPWFYPKAAIWNGRYTLFMWTINGFFGPPSLGDYNYDISVNDVGTDPSTLALTGWWRASFTGAPWIGVTNVFPSTAVRTIEVNSAVGPVLDPERYYRVLTPMNQ